MTSVIRGQANLGGSSHEGKLVFSRPSELIYKRTHWLVSPAVRCEMKMTLTRFDSFV